MAMGRKMDISKIYGVMFNTIVVSNADGDLCSVMM